MPTTVEPQSREPLKAIIYSASGFGLADQAVTARRAIDQRGWQFIHHARDTKASGRSITNRPALTEAIAMLDAGLAGVLVCAKLDRLSASARDFADLMGRSIKHGWFIVCPDIGLDTSTAPGQLVANVFATFAEFERRLMGERAKASHEVRRQRGLRSGQLPLLPAEVRERIAREVSEGRSLRAIADQLNTEQVSTAKGGTWYASTVRHVARSVAREAALATAVQDATKAA
jgi:DNA invertase Pin-like site-specific DNA recombinase